jgi:serine/threonine-protein kinase RsbW
VGVVRLAISSLARAVAVPEENLDDLKIAVSEACTNAVLAHEENDIGDPVTITWMDKQDRFVVEVGDRGPVYDESVADEEDSLGLSTRRAMSFALISTLVDESEFEPREGGGMRARMVIYR